MTVRATLLVLLGVGACSFGIDFHDGLACNEQYPCIEGYACVAEKCRPLNADGTVDADGPADLVVGEIMVVSDDNGDDEINRGETVVLNLGITNIGGETASAVNGVLATTDTTVTISDNEASFGDIYGGDTEWGGGYSTFISAFELIVDVIATPHAIPLTIELSTDDAGSFTRSFDVSVVPIAASLGVSSTLVVSDNNGDDMINKGETIVLNIAVQNTGTSRANAVNGTLSTSDAYVTMTDTTASYGHIASGDAEWPGGVLTSTSNPKADENVA